MDEQTIKYYEDNALEIFERYKKATAGIAQFFTTAFPSGSKVIYVGAGSGRDMQILLDMGYEISGVEPSDALRNIAIQKHEGLEGRLEKGQLPNLPERYNNSFDGVLCSAVLMHIPKEHFFDSALSIKRILKQNGRLLVSIPSSGQELNANRRDENGRLFNDYNPEYLQLLFERIGFQLIGKWISEDGLGRENRTWITMLFSLVNSLNIRPLDQIEGILNRDKKFATYKLALFRAFCEIAMTNFNQVSWEKDGYVRVPVNLLAEKWIYYYWPLIESKQFLPQIYGETATGKNPIAFRATLQNLVNCYVNNGGLHRFSLDLRNSTFSDEAKVLTEAALKKITRTIVSGPVTYAGGSLETGKVFQYIKEDKTVRFSAEIWRELSLMSHWINDAIILRWAELTSEISKKAVRPSDVFDLLLEVPLPERDVNEVRKFYLGEQNKECIWTGKRLNQNFDIDHVIPFSLWRNNDLWNILPCDSVVNREKKDMLPTRHLILKRKDIIVDYWQRSHQNNPPRFEFETKRIISGSFTHKWENELFIFLLDAVEITAIQRSVQRWEPAKMYS